MNQDTRENIDLIANNYFKSTIALFETITFFNYSIASVYDDKNEKMVESFNKLEQILLEQKKEEKEDSGTKLILTHMPSLCFSSLVSAFENFLIEMLALALKMHPHKIAKESVDLKKVIELSREEIILFKANEYINQIMYKTPKDYLKSLSNILSLSEESIAPAFNMYIEIKARRDLGVHNNWRKNEIYERKVAEAKISPPTKNILSPNLEYYKYAFNVCSFLVQKISNQTCKNLFKVHALFDEKRFNFDIDKVAIPKD
ncbi:TPA: hypothetical protein ACT2S9_003736 [Enterobacter hormaechei]|nr:hypothetical protein [Enterobacter hormaechei subsp. steigerwaltii]